MAAKDRLKPRLQVLTEPYWALADVDAPYSLRVGQAPDGVAEDKPQRHQDHDPQPYQRHRIDLTLWHALCLPIAPIAYKDEQLGGIASRRLARVVPTYAGMTGHSSGGCRVDSRLRGSDDDSNFYIGISPPRNYCHKAEAGVPRCRLHACVRTPLSPQRSEDGRIPS
jgi:hypothetical protein